eukprot:TRINITY_DN9583_c0_g1_i2.p1 TRINITY_DN9583_c0_g1~~TRINITY_DN9583_c0_g1_i2.p1  ORF type:complete len:130 (-),score=37.01 TRINITY_DN9583_c0_g1_i2:45-434(-)
MCIRDSAMTELACSTNLSQPETSLLRGAETSVNRYGAAMHSSGDGGSISVEQLVQLSKEAAPRLTERQITRREKLSKVLMLTGFVGWLFGRGAIYMLENLSLIHISEPTRLLSISYAVFCLKKKKNKVR